MTFWKPLSLILVFPLLLAGCRSAADLKFENDLKQTGLAYVLYNDLYNKGPADWDQFLDFAKKGEMGADAIQRVRDAEYEFKWKVNLREHKDGAANAVLAERPGGGPKLMMDLSIHQ